MSTLRPKSVPEAVELWQTALAENAVREARRAKRLSLRQSRWIAWHACGRLKSLLSVESQDALERFATLPDARGVAYARAVREVKADCATQALRLRLTARDLDGGARYTAERAVWDCLSLVMGSRAATILPGVLGWVAMSLHGAHNVARGISAWQIALVHEIVHNPYLPLPRVDPARIRAFEEGLILRLAHDIYTTQDYARLPYLADALEEASACSVEILDHLRSARGHLRACWALDLVLGKEPQRRKR